MYDSKLNLINFCGIGYNQLSDNKIKLDQFGFSDQRIIDLDNDSYGDILEICIDYLSEFNLYKLSLKQSNNHNYMNL